MRRRRGIALTLTLLIASAMVSGTRAYRTATPARTHSSLSLFLTALNASDRDSARNATRYLSERHFPTVRAFRAAASIGISPRNTEAIRHLDDPGLQSLVVARAKRIDGYPLQTPYSDMAARFRRLKDRDEAEMLSRRMIEEDPIRARRDLPGLMLRFGQPLQAWTSLDLDAGLFHAVEYVSDAEKNGVAPVTALNYLAFSHPSIRRPEQIHEVYRRAGVPAPLFDERTSRLVERGFQPHRPVRTLRGVYVVPVWTPSDLPRGCSIAELERYAASPDLLLSDPALAELSRRDPKRARPRLNARLAEGSVQDIHFACEHGADDLLTLRRAARHSLHSVRAAVARRLTDLGDPRAATELSRLRRDPARQVRLAAGGR